LPRWDIFVYPSRRQAHGTSVDIENSLALRATPVKARSKRDALLQEVFKAGCASVESVLARNCCGPWRHTQKERPPALPQAAQV